MKLLSKLVSGVSRRESSTDVVSIISLLGSNLDELTIKIFRSYCSILLQQSSTYIVPAVWGVDKDVELDRTQQEMHEIIYPVVDNIISAPQFRDLNGEQAFALRYLIHACLIAKISYIIESFKNTSVRTPIDDSQYKEMSAGFGPIGHA